MSDAHSSCPITLRTGAGEAPGTPGPSCSQEGTSPLPHRLVPTRKWQLWCREGFHSRADGGHALPDGELVLNHSAFLPCSLLQSLSASASSGPGRKRLTEIDSVTKARKVLGCARGYWWVKVGVESSSNQTQQRDWRHPPSLVPALHCPLGGVIQGTTALLGWKPSSVSWLFDPR